MSEEQAPPTSGALEPGRPVPLAALVQQQPGAVVSRTLSRNPSGTLTVFSFDAGQGLSEHTAPYEAHVLILEGTATLTVGGQAVPAAGGEIVRLPAHVPHAVQAVGPFKMLLVMLKG